MEHGLEAERHGARAGRSDRKPFPTTTALSPKPLTPTPTSRQVHLSGVLLSDEGLEKRLAQDDPKHLDSLGPGPLDSVDVSHNSETDEAAKGLVDVPLRKLKLFHNRLRDP